MIIKASERGGAAKLAKHLLNEQDNDHVEVHEIRGFASQSLRGALDEAYAVSRGTRCRKFLFSVTLSPPANENPTDEHYRQAARRIEETMKLTGQPRALVFHEKEGRRHAHVVWTRIDSREMKAINLPFFKSRLNEIAKDLYLEHGWALPKGFISREMRNPLNFTLAEWQRSKRLNDDPKLIRATLQACWNQTSNRQAFEKSLGKCGFYLARGDRRGFVAVDWRGEVYSLTRLLNQSKKDLVARLGDPRGLKSIEEAQAGIDQRCVAQIKALTDTTTQRYRQNMMLLVEKREHLKQRHHMERRAFIRMQTERAAMDASTRQSRFKAGLRGAWDRLTGRHAHIVKINEQEARATLRQERQRFHDLKVSQRQERQRMQQLIEGMKRQEQAELESMKRCIFSRLPVKSDVRYERAFDQVASIHSIEKGLEL